MNKICELIKEKKVACRKKKGAYFLLEIAFFLIFVAIITATAMGSISDTDGAKIATTNQELDQIRTAVIQYKTYRLDNSLTAGGLGFLLNETTIEATNAIDGRVHGPFLSENSRWTTGGLNDMWGNAYTLEQDGDAWYIQSTCGSTDSNKYIKVKL